MAISLQLRPASRIVLSRCSSSAVHGVFVRPFFLGVDSTAGSALGSSIAPTPGFTGEAIMTDPDAGEGGRLREVPGFCCVGRGALGIGMPSKVGTRWKGWICCWASKCGGALVVADVLIRLELGGELSGQREVRSMRRHGYWDNDMIQTRPRCTLTSNPVSLPQLEAGRRS